MTAKLYRVKSARKPQGTCRTCGQPITVGQAYVWFKFRYGSAQKFHDAPECMPTPADRESNAKRRLWNDASDSIATARNADAPAHAAEHLRDALTNVGEIIDLLDESLQGWESTNFEYGEMADAFRSSRDALDDWRADAESIADDLDQMPDEPYDPLVEPTAPDPEDYEDGDPAYSDAFADYEDELSTYREQRETWDDWAASLQTKLDEIDDLPSLDF